MTWGLSNNGIKDIKKRHEQRRKEEKRVGHYDQMRVHVDWEQFSYTYDEIFKLVKDIVLENNRKLEEDIRQMK